MDQDELGRRYREAAPGIMSVLEARAGGATAELLALDTRLAAAGDVASQRRSAMEWTAGVLQHVAALLEG